MHIQLTQEDLDRCHRFSEDVTATTHHIYAKRGQDDPLKVINDAFVGKCGEIAVAKMLLVSGLDCSDPDFAIYTDTKGWAPDLRVGQLGISVKTITATSASRFGKSWCFQNTDAFWQSNDAAFFVVYGEISNRCEIYGPYKAQDLAVLRKPTRLGFASKCAIYFEDLR